MMNPDTSVPAGVFKQTVDFIRKNWPKLLAISAAVLTPCFWHRRLEAGDLGSHVYNAWLVQLVQQHKVSGIWIASQRTNVLFDLLLSAVARIAGLRLSAHFVAGAAVLLFFWGSVALVTAAANRVPWTVLPLIAMVSYGWTFNIGFFNYYLSLAMAFIGIAIVWRGKWWEVFLALALVPLIMLANPLGLVWLVGAAVYIAVLVRVEIRYQIVAFCLAGSILIVVHSYLGSHFVVFTKNHRLLHNGVDQLLLFGPLYILPAAALCGLILIAVFLDVVNRRGKEDLWLIWSIPLQLYVLVFVSTILLPDSIALPQYRAPISLLTSRLTSVSAVLLCCLVGILRPRRWHMIGFGTIAVLFFSLLYFDTASVGRLEAQAEHLIGTLPPGQRVIVTLPNEPNSRLPIEHVVDSACIYHCFEFSNYEASTGQFRVRAQPDNLIVVASHAAMEEMYYGTYKPSASELPMFQIYKCGRSGVDEQLCMRPLSSTRD